MSDVATPADELTGLRVLAVGVDLAVAFCARLARLHGAEVDHVAHDEPPVGRTVGQQCLLYDGAGALATPAADDEWQILVGRYDVVITSRGPAASSAYRAITKEQVHVSITPFGRTGPYAWWAATDTALALLSCTILLGRRLPESVKIPGTQCEFTVGAVAFVSICAALLRRYRDGDGSDIDLAKFEVLASADNGLYSGYSYLGSIRTGIDATFVTGYPVRVFETKDEPVFVAPGFGNVEMLAVLVERPELLDHELFQDPVARQQRTAEFDALVEDWFLSHDARSIVSGAQELRMPFAELTPLRDLPADEQLMHRRFFEARRFGEDTVHVAGTPIARRFGPNIGRSPGSVPASGRTGDGTARSSSKPLAGVRVVDLTRAYAGPIAAAILTELGADVVKIEATARIDMPTRGTNYADNDLSFRPWDRAGFYHSVNNGKKGLTLDLATETGRRLLHRLVADSDLLVENSSARVLPNMGLTDEKLRELNGQLVVVGMSAYGKSGPRKDWVGYAQGMEAAAGMMRLGGYENDTFMSSSCAYADWVLGIYGAAAAVLGLIAAARTGEGSGYDVSGVAGVVGHLGDQIVDAELAGRQPARSGNRPPAGGYVGIHRAHDDRLVLVDAETPSDIATLAAIVVVPGLPAAELDDAVSAWVGTHTRAEAVDALQRAGVVATPVLGPDGVLTDEHLRAREFFEIIDHPLVGSRPHQRFMPAIWNGQPRPTRTPAPLLGEHNAAVLGKRLGLDTSELASLEQEGVIGDEPTRLPRRLRDRSLDLPALQKAGVIVLDPEYRTRLSTFFGVEIGANHRLRQPSQELT